MNKKKLITSVTLFSMALNLTGGALTAHAETTATGNEPVITATTDSGVATEATQDSTVESTEATTESSSSASEDQKPAQQKETAPSAEPKGATTETSASTEPVKVKATGISVDATTFPCPNLLSKAKLADKDRDGILTPAEIATVTSLYFGSFSTLTDVTGLEHFTGVTDLTIFNWGQSALTIPNLPNLIDLRVSDSRHLTQIDVKQAVNLQELDVTYNQLTSLDVSGMQQLTNISYSGNDSTMTTLDLRDCSSLISAHHSIAQEVVYISAGMTDYIGCPYVPNHTGNVVIDLKGFYTIDAKGNKVIDMNKVLSPAMIQVFANANPDGFDTATNVLTLPPGAAKTEFEAGKGYNGTTKWTFFTELNKVDDIVANFNTNGGSLVEAQTIAKGSTATRPTDPTKDGFDFVDWYTDDTLTTLADFSQGLATDITYYAKWQPSATKPVTEKITVAFETNGGTKIASQKIAKNTAPTQPEAPTREGYLFNGWFTDKELTTAADLTGKLTSDTTYYAAWKMVDEPPVVDLVTVTFETNGGTAIDKQELQKGTKATLPEAPTKDGFTFAGWFTDKELTQAFDFETAVSNDLTLYGKWTAVAGNPGNTGTSQGTTSGTTTITGYRKLLPKTGVESSIGLSITGALVLLGSLVLLKRKKNQA